MPCRLVDVSGSTSRPLLRRRERNRCSQLQFFLVYLRGQRESTTRDLTSAYPVETGSPPFRVDGAYYTIFRYKKSSGYRGRIFAAAQSSFKRSPFKRHAKFCNFNFSFRSGEIFNSKSLFSGVMSFFSFKLPVKQS